MNKHSQISSIEQLDKAIASVEKELRHSRKRLSQRRGLFGRASTIAGIAGRIPEFLSGLALVMSLIGKFKKHK